MLQKLLELLTEAEEISKNLSDLTEEERMGLSRLKRRVWQRCQTQIRMRATARVRSEMARAFGPKPPPTIM